MVKERITKKVKETAKEQSQNKSINSFESNQTDLQSVVETKLMNSKVYSLIAIGALLTTLLSFIPLPLTPLVVIGLIVASSKIPFFNIDTIQAGAIGASIGIIGVLVPFSLSLLLPVYILEGALGGAIYGLIGWFIASIINKLSII